MVRSSASAPRWASAPKSCTAAVLSRWRNLLLRNTRLWGPGRCGSRPADFGFLARLALRLRRLCYSAYFHPEDLMRFFSAAVLSSVVLLSCLSPSVSGHEPESSTTAQSIFGFRYAAAENATEAKFLAV